MSAVSGWAERLGSTLWDLSWQLTVLVIAVWLVSLCCKRLSPGFRYLLWCVVLVRLCFPVNLHLPVGMSGHVERAAGVSVSSVFEKPVDPVIVQPAPAVMQPAPVAAKEVEAVERTPENALLTEPMPIRVEVPEVETLFDPPVTLAAKLVLLWAGLVTLLAGLVAGRIIRALLVLHRCPRVADPDFLAEFAALRLQAGVRRKVKVLECDASGPFSTPCVFGFLRPVLLISRPMIEEWDTAARKPVLLHELAHIKRMDLMVNAFQIVVQILFFFHPLVWFANRRIRHERELACDDLAIAHCGNRRKQYSESILRVVEESQQKRLAFAAASIGITEQRSTLGKRIVRIMSEKYRQHQRMGILSVLLLLGLSAICVAVASERAEPKPEVGVAINLEMPWSDGSGSPFWRYEMKDGAFRVINPDPYSPAIADYPIGLWIWPNKLSVMEVTYRAEGLDVADPEKPVMVFTRENSDDVTVLFMSDLEVDGREHTLRIDLSERVPKMKGRKQRLGYLDLYVHTAKGSEGWFELSALRFEPGDGVKLPPEKKEDFLTHVRVVDLAGEAIPDATVLLDSHLLNKTVEMKTDQEGRVVLTPAVQGGLLLQRSVLISKGGYTPVLFKNDYGMGRSKESEIVAILGPSQILSGVVVDGDGNPLANAVGNIRIDGGPDLGRVGYPGMGEMSRVVTDENGRWVSPPVCAAPGSSVDVRWKKMGYYHDVLAGLEMSFNLDDHMAKAILKPAMMVSGKVTDHEGNPIKNASVVAGDSHYNIDFRPTFTDADGRYVMSGIQENQLVVDDELVVTVTADGFAPQLVKILSPAPGMDPIDFILKPAIPFKFRVIDTDGKPVKDARISPSFWKECETLTGRISTDGNGEAVWMGPEDPVEFSIYADGKLGQSKLEFEPSHGDGDVHVVTLRNAAKVILSVNDVQTGEPISRFDIEEGRIWEDESSRPLQWLELSRYSNEGRDGRWEYDFRDAQNRRLRIRAEGYAPFVTEVVDINEELTEINVELIPGEDITATVLDPAGNPVTGAEVIMVDEKEWVMIFGNSREQFNRKGTAVTDSSGTFSFPSEGDASFRLLISCDEGFWHGDRTELESGNGKIQLLPWATVSGTVLVGNKPKSGQSVLISSNNFVKEKKYLMHYLEARCDADGRFIHRRVPPGEYQIGRKVTQGRASVISEATSHEIKAGDQLTLEIGGAGQAVIGQCLWDRVEAHTASVTMMMQESGSEKNKQFFFGTVDQDGGFRVDNLLPGQYELTISVSELGDLSQGPFGQAVGSVKLDVVVPELPAGVKYIDTPIDVGVHEITIGEKGRGVAGQCIWDGEEDCITIVGLSSANLKTGATEQNYSAEVFENGGFYFENVVPGQYELEVMIFARRDLEGFGNPFGNQIGELKVEIEVPELIAGEKTDTPVDLGELKIEITAPETEI